MADIIAERTTHLATMNRKLDRFQTAIDHDPSAEHPVDVRETVAAVREEVLADQPDGAVTVDVPDGLRVEADENLVDALTELIENSIVHGGGGLSLLRAARTDTGNHCRGRWTGYSGTRSGSADGRDGDHATGP